MKIYKTSNILHVCASLDFILNTSIDQKTSSLPQ